MPKKRLYKVKRGSFSFPSPKATCSGLCMCKKVTVWKCLKRQALVSEGWGAQAIFGATLMGSSFLYIVWFIARAGWDANRDIYGRSFFERLSNRRRGGVVERF